MRPEQLRGAVSRSIPILLPCGAFEYHGENLPLGTDTLIAEGFCLRVAELAEACVFDKVVLCGYDEYVDYSLLSSNLNISERMPIGHAGRGETQLIQSERQLRGENQKLELDLLQAKINPYFYTIRYRPSRLYRGILNWKRLWTRW